MKSYPIDNIILKYLKDNDHKKVIVNNYVYEMFNVKSSTEFMIKPGHGLFTGIVDDSNMFDEVKYVIYNNTESFELQSIKKNNIWTFCSTGLFLDKINVKVQLTNPVDHLIIFGNFILLDNECERLILSLPIITMSTCDNRTINIICGYKYVS